MSDDKTLSSKIRFGFKDLIEMRSNNWTARRVEEKAKKLSEIRKDDNHSNQSTPRSTNSTPRHGQAFGAGGARGGGGFQDARHGNNTTTNDRKSQPDAPVDEWTTVATTARGKKTIKIIHFLLLLRRRPIQHRLLLWVTKTNSPL